MPVPGKTLDQNTIRYLETLHDSVKTVTPTGRIHYTESFQEQVIRRYREGDGPVAIFRENGLGPEIIGYKRIERCIARWCNSPRTRQERIDRIEREITYLTRQADRLRKLPASNEEDQ